MALNSHATSQILDLLAGDEMVAVWRDLLTEAEAAFRIHKSDLAIRPV